MAYLTLIANFAELVHIISAASVSALETWDAAARDALPKSIKIWLVLMMINNVAAIAFLKNHVAARWVFGGFLISHLIVILGFWKTGTPILAGQVSLFHFLFWTPGIYMLWRKRSEIKWITPYAVWASLVVIFYLGSMTIDIKDSLVYLSHVIGK